MVFVSILRVVICFRLHSIPINCLFLSCLLTLKELRTGKSSGFQSNIHASDKYILSFISVCSVFRSIRVKQRLGLN